MPKQGVENSDSGRTRPIGYPPGFDPFAPAGQYSDVVNANHEIPRARLGGWRLRIAKISLWVLTALTCIYSSGIILVAVQGLLPEFCTSKLLCLQLNLPAETFGILIVLGVNCLILGNLWWAVLALSESVLHSNSGDESNGFRTFAWCARAVCIVCGVAAVLPALLFGFVFVMFHLLPFVVLALLLGGLALFVLAVIKWRKS